MPGYSIRLLPPNSNKFSHDKLVEVSQIMSGKVISTPPVVFDRGAKQPRAGFDTSSVQITEYGLKARYLLEEEVIIPTVEGEAKNFRIVAIEGKFIQKEGILLISSFTDAVDTIAKIWADLFFPDRIIDCLGIKLSLDQLHELVTRYARTVIDISHIECKGLEKIRMKAYDLQEKEWYKQENFDSYKVDQLTFIPKLSGELAKKTPICRIYRTGRFVMYHNANFSLKEFEQIELQLVGMIASILGSPLCKYGSASSQGRLVK